MIIVYLLKHLYRLMDCVHDMMHQSDLRTRIPFSVPSSVPIGVVGPSEVLSCMHKPLICEYAGEEVAIWMAMVQIELLRHCWTFSVPCCYQDDGAIFKSSFCAHVQELCPITWYIHTRSSSAHPSDTFSVQDSMQEHPLLGARLHHRMWRTKKWQPCKRSTSNKISKSWDLCRFLQVVLGLWTSLGKYTGHGSS